MKINLIDARLLDHSGGSDENLAKFGSPSQIHRRILLDMTDEIIQYYGRPKDDCECFICELQRKYIE